MESQAPQTFEEIKARLDEIVAAVSDEELPLDEALSLYEEAVGIGLTASRIVEEGIAAKEAGIRRGSSLVGFGYFVLGRIGGGAVWPAYLTPSILQTS